MGGLGRTYRERLDWLDALRGVLAISVMCYHLLGYVYDVRLRAIGSYAVYIFFVLSGFAMTWVYDEEETDGFPVRSFYVARLARILPMWWLATIATFVAYYDGGRWGRLLENLTFMSALTPTGDIALGGWSIEVEVVFYLLFPALVTIVRTPRAMAALFLGALAIRFAYMPGTWREGQLLPDRVYHLTMPSFLVFFAGGMVAARVRRSAGSLPNGTALGLAGAAIVAAVLSFSWVSVRQLLGGPLSLGLILGCVLAVGLVSCAPNPRARAVRWVCATLGAVSYGTYLLHPLVFLVVDKLGLPAPLTIATTVAGTLVAAWFTYRWFERPAGVWLRRRFPTPPAPPSAERALAEPS